MPLTILVARVFMKNKHGSYIARFVLLSRFLKLKVKSGIQLFVLKSPSVTRKCRLSVPILNNLKKNSALLILLDPSSFMARKISVEREGSDLALGRKEDVSVEATEIARVFLMRPVIPVEEVSASPFILHFIYRAGTAHLQLNQQAGTEGTYEPIAVLKNTLNILDARWKLAGKHFAVHTSQINSSTNISQEHISKS